MELDSEMHFWRPHPNYLRQPPFLAPSPFIHNCIYLLSFVHIASLILCSRTLQLLINDFMSLVTVPLAFIHQFANRLLRKILFNRDTALRLTYLIGVLGKFPITALASKPFKLRTFPVLSLDSPTFAPCLKIIKELPSSSLPLV